MSVLIPFRPWMLDSQHVESSTWSISNISYGHGIVKATHWDSVAEFVFLDHFLQHNLAVRHVFLMAFWMNKISYVLSKDTWKEYGSSQPQTGSYREKGVLEGSYFINSIALKISMDINARAPAVMDYTWQNINKNTITQFKNEPFRNIALCNQLMINIQYFNKIIQ